MSNNSLIKENILKYLEFNRITKYEFYQKTGISNGVLSKSNGLSEDSILKFISYYTDINPTWLLTGKGEMILTEELKESKKTILDLENERILKEIRELNKEDQERILITIDALVRDSKNQKSKK